MKNLTNIEIDVISGGNGPISKALVKLDEVVTDIYDLLDPRGMSGFFIALSILPVIIMHVIICCDSCNPKKKPRIK